MVVDIYIYVCIDRQNSINYSYEKSTEDEIILTSPKDS